MIQRKELYHKGWKIKEESKRSPELLRIPEFPSSDQYIFFFYQGWYELFVCNISATVFADEQVFFILFFIELES